MKNFMPSPEIPRSEQDINLKSSDDVLELPLHDSYASSEYLNNTTEEQHYEMFPQDPVFNDYEATVRGFNDSMEKTVSLAIKKVIHLDKDVEEAYAISTMLHAKYSRWGKEESFSDETVVQNFLSLEILKTYLNSLVEKSQNPDAAIKKLGTILSLVDFKYPDSEKYGDTDEKDSFLEGFSDTPWTKAALETLLYEKNRIDLSMDAFEKRGSFHPSDPNVDEKIDFHLGSSNWITNEKWKKRFKEDIEEKIEKASKNVQHFYHRCELKDDFVWASLIGGQRFLFIKRFPLDGDWVYAWAEDNKSESGWQPMRFSKHGSAQRLFSDGQNKTEEDLKKEQYIQRVILEALLKAEED